MFHIQNVLLLSNLLPAFKISITTLTMYLFIKLFYFEDDIYNDINKYISYIKNQALSLPINIGYYILYTYSSCCIKYNKLCKYISFKNHNNNLPNKELDTLEFYDNELTNTSCCYGSPIIISDFSSIHDDKLIIFTDKNNINETNNETDNVCFNKVIFYSYPKTLDYIVSNIQFITLDLHYDNKTYSICLKNKKHNYYVVNNCLNKDFFKYYIKNVLSINNITFDNFDYKITLIDNNVDIFELSNKQYIIIGENDYELKSIEDDLTPEVSEQNDFVNVEINDDDTFRNYYAQIE